jgi:membrane fusion protein (multidrug efflux system)
MRYFHRTAIAGIGAAVLLVACGHKAAVAPPPPQVNVVVAEARTAENIVELPGRVQAVRIAQVRARVDGIVQRRLYNEGSDVKAGQVLFLIDPQQLSASLSAVQASLTRAEATAANAAQDVDRYKGLVEEQAISKQEYDAAVARLRTAQADVAQTRAQLESAKLNLGYTSVVAPISGRAGRAQVTEGALVSAASATLLTTIEQFDPVYVNFSQSSASLLAIRRDIAAGVYTVPALNRIDVALVLEDGSDYPHAGHLNFLDLSIDQATGTVASRAEIPNPNQQLLPGQFVRARIKAGVRPHEILIPQRAVKVLSQGASVMIVDDKGMAQTRAVKVGALVGDSWEITEGLKGGERVIVDGLQKVHAGAPVTVSIAPAPPASPPATKNTAPAGK